MPHRTPEHYFRHTLQAGSSIDTFDSLKKIRPIAREAYELIGEKDWKEQTLEDTDVAEKDLRAGFIGSVAVLGATLLHDGKIIGQDKNKVNRELDGLLIGLSVLFNVTGREPIQGSSGLAIGNGPRRFEVRAYDLESKRFGRVHYAELAEYLGGASIRGSGTNRGRSSHTGQRRGASGINSM